MTGKEQVKAIVEKYNKSISDRSENATEKETQNSHEVRCTRV